MSNRNEIPRSQTVATSRRAAMAFVLLLGVVSLLADMTYEGARSLVAFSVVTQLAAVPVLLMVRRR